MDDDLEMMTREQLIGEARRLRTGIRVHRDSTGHALCWHHPALLGPPTREDRPAADGPYVAGVSPGLPAGPPVPGRSVA